MVQKNRRGQADIELDSGDGKAKVTQTRGFKVWSSTRDSGITVEATATVKLTCGQTKAHIKDAAEEAAMLAEKLAIDGMEEMGLYIKQYDKNGSLPLGGIE